jgi:hypothetical protein
VSVRVILYLPKGTIKEYPDVIRVTVDDMFVEFTNRQNGELLKSNLPYPIITTENRGTEISA